MHLTYGIYDSTTGVTHKFYDDFTFNEMMNALIDEVKNQHGYIITYYC